MERRLGITEARKELTRIINEVRYRGENYIIVQHGQPAAAVVPVEVYRQWQQEQEDLFAAIRNVQAASAEADPDQIMEDVLEAQRAVRQISAE